MSDYELPDWRRTASIFPPDLQEAFTDALILSSIPSSQRDHNEEEELRIALATLRRERMRVVSAASGEFLKAISWENLAGGEKGELVIYLGERVEPVLEATVPPRKLPHPLTHTTVANYLEKIISHTISLGGLLEEIEPLHRAVQAHHKRMNMILKLISPQSSEWQANGLAQVLTPPHIMDAVLTIEEAFEKVKRRMETVLQCKQIATTISGILQVSPVHDGFQPEVDPPKASESRSARAYTSRLKRPRDN